MSYINNQLAKISGKLSYFLGIATIIIYILSSYGIVIAEFWKWFIVPVFNVEPITWLSAIGLLLFVSLFKIKVTVTQEYSASAFLMFLLNPWITWCVGFTLHLLNK